jgi:import inner membrane translocase subunit TIM21
VSPNRVFDRSFDFIRKDSDVQSWYGDTLKAHGRDHDGHREGRQNFVEHTQYKNEEDGSQRTRVRYNVEGQFGEAFVFAEVSNQMPSGEFVYILVQDKSNARVQTVVDNRAALTAQRLSGSQESQSAMTQLLFGSGKK